MIEVKRGDIYLADLGQAIGRENAGIRPVVIVQSDIGNQYSPTTIVALIRIYNDKPKLPTHVPLKAGNFGIQRDSIIMLEMLRTIDKSRLGGYIGTLDDIAMMHMRRALLFSLGIGK